MSAPESTIPTTRHFAIECLSSLMVLSVSYALLRWHYNPSYSFWATALLGVLLITQRAVLWNPPREDASALFNLQKHNILPPTVLLIAAATLHAFWNGDDTMLAAAAFGYYASLYSIGTAFRKTFFRGITIPFFALLISATSAADPFSRNTEPFVCVVGVFLIAVTLMVISDMTSARLQKIPEPRRLFLLGCHLSVCLFSIFGIYRLKPTDINERLAAMTRSYIETDDRHPREIAQDILNKQEVLMGELLVKIEAFGQSGGQYPDLEGDIPDAMQKLWNAQSAWLAFRDAQLAMFWPHPNKSRYGTIYSTCYNLVKSELTKARIVELKMLMPGDGKASDLCASQWPN